MSAARVFWASGALGLLLALPAACQRPAARAVPDTPQAALLRGEYDRAIELARTRLAEAGASDEDRETLARSLVEVGRYPEAEAALRSFPGRAERWAPLLGELALLQGRLGEADSLFRLTWEESGAVLFSRVRLGQVLMRQGRWGEARALFLAVTRAARASPRLPARELAAVAQAYRALGAEDPGQYRDALQYYDAALAADSTDDATRVELGDLFLEKYNRPDALATYRLVLARNPKHPGALLGAARVALAEGGGEGDAVELLRQALQVNPRSAPAHVALAASHLDREAYADALTEAGKALAVDPGSLPALTVQATAQLLQGDTAAFEATRRAVLARNPRYAAFYADLAEQSARNRFYRQAVDYAARGVALDSASAPALTALGLNQLRLGAMADGRASLERAFRLDPYNVWVKNTLDLLDAFSRYGQRATPRFRFYAAPEEVDLVALYLGELAEEGYDRLSARYGYRPEPPIQVEVYRSHADFSVRTVGLAGLGALGVSFGGVLAMDSPSARSRGDFNWGSTFWHELAHVFTLGMTEHRVPRWVSEGLSVLEERRARTGWGAGLRLAYLQAYHQGKLLPVSRLNDGFVRPAYPEQVGFSYYQASLVCEMIETTRGSPALLALLDGYRRGWDTPAAFRGALGVEPEAFDREFDAWFRQRFAAALAAADGPEGGPFHREMTAGLELLGRGQREEARERFERAKALFPDYAEPGGPSWHMARIHRAAGRLREAADELAWLTARAENDYDANLEEADVREQLGDSAGAALALERAVYIDPRDLGLHRRLAGLLAGLGDWKRAARERLAVVALRPVDRAEALYQVALAWFEGGDVPSARRAVLQALEIAPGFERAQDLLLRIRERAP